MVEVSEVTKVAEVKKTIEVVVQSDDDAFLLFDHSGATHVAVDGDAIGRWVVDVASREDTPTVGLRPSPWLKMAARFLESEGFEAVAIEGECVAVHVVVQVTLEGGRLVSAAVAPPAGKMRAVTSVARLGAVLADLSRDTSMPRVPAGAPPSYVEKLAEQAMRAVTGP